MGFRFAPLFELEEDGAEIDVRAGCLWIALDRLLVGGDNLFNGRARLFQLNSTLKPMRGLALTCGDLFVPDILRSLARELQKPADLVAIEIQKELSRERLHLFPIDLH